MRLRKDPRTIKIHRLKLANQPHQEERELVGTVQAYDLPEAIRDWVHAKWDDTVWADALFKANTVSIVTREGHEEMYVATD
jgi:hypothetical protein